MVSDERPEWAKRDDAAIYGDDNGGGELSRFRYWLTREHLSGTHPDYGSRPFVVCGLNPSTATASTNDPTIVREMGFAKRERCNRLVKVNAYAWRDTKPADMWKHDAREPGSIVGPENRRYIREACELTWMDDGIFVVAWGSNIERLHERRIYALIKSTGVIPMCFGVNNDGSPTHPLYQPKDMELCEWSLK